MVDRLSGQRADVLVHAKEVLGVVLGFDLLEPPVVGPVCCGDWVTSLVVIQVVDVSTGGEEGLHLLVGFARPGDAEARVRRLPPLSEYEEIVAFAPVRECRLADTYPGCRAVDMLEEQLAHGRGAAREAIYHGVDSCVAQLPEETRLPVVEGTFRVVGIEHAVELRVGHRPDCVQNGGTELLQRPHGLLRVGQWAAMAGDQRGHLGAGAVGRMCQGCEQRVLIG